MAEIHELTAVQLRDALRSGDVSARQAVEHFLARIDAGNPLLGAFITVTAEQAMSGRRAGRRPPCATGPYRRRGRCRAARHAGRLQGPDGRRRGGHHPRQCRPGPQACPVRRRRWPATLKGAGCISLGKTQVPEFGLTAYSENRVAPPSRNPHALSRSSGGSSGGSAAAVAAGLLPFAPGSDGGGSDPDSGRGLRPGGPETGPRAGARGESAGDPAGLVVAGPLARSAADAALMLDALVAGPAGTGRPDGYRRRGLP